LTNGGSFLMLVELFLLDGASSCLSIAGSDVTGS
jgi:hypothetical protein